MKNFLLISPVLLLLNCFTFGAAGYLVPAEDDSRVFAGDTVIAEKCAVVVTNIGNDLNANLKSTGKTTVNDVGIQVTGSNCLQIRPLK